MTREAHERRAKHHEVADASGLGQAPSAHPKQLVKR
jgi:hypothetical protein